MSKKKKIETSRKKKIIEFNCPSCGNPLPANNVCNRITCHWCHQKIIPEGFGALKGQHAEIFAESERYKEWLKTDEGIEYEKRKRR